MNTSTIKSVTKKPWKHYKQCDYCATMQVPVLPEGGCKHYRGGKTQSDHQSKKSGQNG
jgi:hypothetical protein